MTEIPQSVVRAADAVIDQGVLGALLVLSLAANVALVFALVRCYRSGLKRYYNDTNHF